MPRTDSSIAHAAASLERNVGATPTHEQLKWAAIGRLLAGDTAAAVRWLERAAALPPVDANNLCDLSATYQLRAAAEQDGSDLARAIDAARRGLAQDPDNAVCTFNLALALRQSGLAAMADDAFSRAADLERGAWADEARSRRRPPGAADGREGLMREIEPILLEGDLSAIDDQIARHVDVVHELLERTILRLWAEAIRRSDRVAASRLKQRAQAIASRIMVANQDAHPRDLVAFFDRCTRTCADGWINHLAAMTAWYEERFVDARKANHAADSAFGSNPSPVNASRILLRVTLARLDGRAEEARSWMDVHRRAYAKAGYGSVTGRLTWQTALLESERSNFGGSVALYRDAAAWLTKTRDREGAAMVHSLLAAKFQQLGDFHLAWKHSLAAIARLDACRELRQRAILAATAVLATADGLEDAAMAFRAPLVDRARRTKTAVYLARVLSEEASTLLRLGRIDAARERLREADENLVQIDDPAAAAMSRALVQSVHGRLEAESSPREADAHFATAAEIYRARGNTFATPAIELERGRALLRAGDQAAAERAFQRGVEAAERERLSSSVDAQRVGLLSARWDLYTALIDLQIRLQNEDAAAALLDKARAVNLVEALPQSRERDGRSLPGGTIALEYAVLPSGVHAWVTADGQRRRFMLPIAIRALEDRVSQYIDGIRRRVDRAQLERLSGELFEVLCEPIRDRLAAATRLVIVPDGPLHAVPFAALLDPSSGTPLVDRVAIVVMPSLAFLSAPAPGSPAMPRFDVVAVGSALGRVSGTDRLAGLPGADREASTIAALYGRGQLMRGTEATRARVLEAAGLGRVLHFAGHALVDPRDPSLSRIVVSPAPNDDIGAIFAADIASLDLRAVRLVVLSACETAGGRFMRGEGVVGLARTFLRSGVSSVIATQWPVEDRAAVDLGIAIHRELIAGRSTADALRVAQMTLRRNGRADVVDWAAPIVLGRDITVTRSASVERSSLR